MKKVLFIAIIMLLSSKIITAQEEKKEGKENIYVKLKEGAKPTIYIDGKVFDFPMDLIDQNKIASVFVVKGEQALKKYNAPNGVILIKTKELEATGISNLKIEKNKNTITDKNAPMVIVDGKVTDRKTLDTISPNTIKKMEVLKGEKAIEKYNSPNGVIIITTKKM
ncbi:hypothetical protein H0I29_10310 [Polaribacter sp. R2A056_3_33]|uniref:hypothetical protein n=1 Tax=Polaribacter sp. R2A056_3_33 TaxID=2745563 RepID=UPI001C4FB057|nr:hypothetical protein [Polaribacter sp. R2A056_3_33]QXP69036.1 hypothetical protein H0I29_10310 [Polaribacter sp. R2A056_3_33]